jgi:galactose binding lectin-like protein
MTGSRIALAAALLAELIFAPGASRGGTVTICREVVESGTAFLDCPSGYIITEIVFASYGTPGGTCGAYQPGVCDAANCYSIVSTVCLGQPGCQIPASNNVFGDPCPGTGKRLNIEARCSAGSNPLGSRLCAQAGEGETAILAAPSGEVITRIDFASYGTPGGFCSSYFAGSCDAATSRAIVEDECLGKTTCSVVASNNIFGDPCGGAGKRLYIQAHSDPLSPTPSRRASWGYLKMRYR